jgi:hypothetical protein
LTTQCAQLDEANRAWQQFHQTQLDNFRNKLRDYLPLDDNISFDQVPQLIVNQIIKEREEFNQELRSSKIFIQSKFNSFFYVELATNLKTIDELTQELLDLKERNTETSGKYLITNNLKYFSYFIRIFID